MVEAARMDRPWCLIDYEGEGEMKAAARTVFIILAFQVTASVWAAQIRGTFYPEKRVYLVGEPIFVVLDLTNPGPRPVWVSQSCVWADTRFEARTAPKSHRGVNLFGCFTGGTAGSCLGGSVEIRPGRHFRRQYLLDGPFVLDAPGTYPIRASHKVAIYAEGTGFRVVASQKMVSKFTVTLVKGSEEQLESAYAPIMRDLKSSDALTSWLARSAVVQNPPSFKT